MSIPAVTLIQIIAAGTQMLTAFAELMPKVRMLLDAGDLSDEEKARLDSDLAAWAESNRALSATIQSYRRA